MARPIQTPVPGTLLRNEFGLRGRVELQLGEEIIPVVNVADLARGAGVPIERTVTGRFVSNGVVGEYFVFQMVVPPSTLVRLGHLHVWADTAGTLKMHLGNALAATPASKLTIRFSDGRLTVPDFINPAVFPTFDTAAAGLGNDCEALYGIASADTPLDLDLSHVVVGSDDNSSYGFVEMSYTIANAKVQGTLTWKEYVAG
ncbi:MAG: hypothetical protein P8099_19955 [Gemmatimonadota bacterium]